MKNNKSINNKGITLIALVITIIVVLILAGITIANISGNESVPNQAVKVKSDAEIQELKNKLEMALITVFNEKGDLDVADVKNAILDKFSNATIKSTDFPLEVVIDNTSLWIEGDNNITSKIYTPKEYIKSTGTQYIDTGVNPANTVDFEITFKTDVNAMTESNTGKNSLFGATNSDTNRVIAFNFGTKANQTYMFLWKNDTTYEDSNTDIIKFSTSTYKPKNKLTISCINNTWKVNNNIINTSASVGDWKENNISMCIFGKSFIIDNEKSTRPFYENMYLYSLKIWDEGKLVRDFIPVESLESGHENEACLYDLVQGKFYYNNGTGDFETNE